MTLSPLIVDEHRRDLVRAGGSRRPGRRSIRVTLRRVARTVARLPAARRRARGAPAAHPIGPP